MKESHIKKLLKFIKDNGKEIEDYAFIHQKKKGKIKVKFYCSDSFRMKVRDILLESLKVEPKARIKSTIEGVPTMEDIQYQKLQLIRRIKKENKVETKSRRIK